MRAPTCQAAAFHPRGPAAARAPGGSACRAESICCRPQRHRAPAQLSTLASAAALCLSRSSRSRPQLALGCNSGHRPQALADPLARCPPLLAQEHSHDDTSLEREGGDRGLRDGNAHSRAGGAAPGMCWGAGRGQGVCLFPLELCKMPPSLGLRGTTCPQRGQAGMGCKDSRDAGISCACWLLTAGAGRAPGSSQAVPSPSLPNKGSAMNSPPEPNKQLLSVGSILLLYQTTSSPSKTLFAGCRRRQDSREAAVSQPDGRPGSQHRWLSPLAWQRPLGKVTGSLVIPAGKNSRGRGASACAQGGTGGAAEPPKPGEQSQTSLVSQNKTKKKAEKFPILAQLLGWGRIRHPVGRENDTHTHPTPGLFWGGGYPGRTPAQGQTLQRHRLCSSALAPIRPVPRPAALIMSWQAPGCLFPTKNPHPLEDTGFLTRG